MDAHRLAVLGFPIHHSKSPAIHRAAYARLGLDWVFSKVRIGVPGFRAFVDGRDRSWRGLSATMPLKEAAYAIAQRHDRIAAESGVVNTLLRIGEEAGGTGQWAGFNTDVPGLARAIAKAGLDVRNAVVLGAGATSVSAVLALRSLGAEQVTVFARRAEAAREVADRFDGTREESEARSLRVHSSVLDRSDLASAASADVTAVVSTLPGAAGHSVEVHEGLLRAPLFDVAYDPWPSPLSLRWERAGTPTHTGLGMLVEQALIQVRIYVHGDPARPLSDEEALVADMAAAGMGG